MKKFNSNILIFRIWTQRSRVFTAVYTIYSNSHIHFWEERKNEYYWILPSGYEQIHTDQFSMHFFFIIFFFFFNRKPFVRLHLLTIENFQFILCAPRWCAKWMNAYAIRIRAYARIFFHRYSCAGAFYDVVGIKTIARGLCRTMKEHVAEIYRIWCEFWKKIIIFSAFWYALNLFTYLVHRWFFSRARTFHFPWHIVILSRNSNQNAIYGRNDAYYCLVSMGAFGCFFAIFISQCALGVGIRSRKVRTISSPRCRILALNKKITLSLPSIVAFSSIHLATNTKTPKFENGIMLLQIQILSILMNDWLSVSVEAWRVLVVLTLIRTKIDRTIGARYDFNLLAQFSSYIVRTYIPYIHRSWTMHRLFHTGHGGKRERNKIPCLAVVWIV